MEKSIVHTSAEQPIAHELWWQVLRRLRWLLGGVVALAFAIGQLIEALLLRDSQSRLAWDVIG